VSDHVEGGTGVVWPPGFTSEVNEPRAVRVEARTEHCVFVIRQSDCNTNT